LELLSLDCIPFAVVKLTEKGIINNINLLAENLTGYNSAELAGQHITFIVKDCDIIDKIGKHEQNKKDTARLASGSIVKLLDKSHDLSSCGLRVSDVEGGFIVCFTDIRTGSSLAAKDVSADAEQILNGMEEAFWQWDVLADTLFFSAQAMALLGYQKESSCCDMSFWQKHIAQKDLKDIYQQVEQHIAGNLPCVSLTFPVIQLAGTKKWVSCIGKVLEYKKGKAHKLFASLKDVTESHALIASLKESNDYLSLAEQLNNSGHWRIDLRTNALFWSRGMYLIHQVDFASYKPRIGRSLAFYGQQEGKRIRQQIQKAIIEKKGFHCQSTITTMLGNKTKVESLGEVELDEAGEVVSVFGIFRDITRTEDIFEKLKLLAMVNHTIKVPIFFIDELDNIVYQDLSPQVDNQSSVLFNYINFSLNDYLVFKEEVKKQGQLKKQVSVSIITTAFMIFQLPMNQARVFISGLLKM
jgi:PAS domain-containing protein